MSGAPRVLVADDDPAIRKALGIILSGYAVREAGDGAEALKLFEAEGADLVLSDLQMPAVGGLELLRRVKGQVWLTEVGGLVKRRRKKKYTVKAIPESEAHARRVTTYLFDDLLPVNRRITRVYLYHWNTATKTDPWDSALIGPDDRARPAFWVLYRNLRDAARR